MIKYEMIIDGTEYKALFTDHFEASDFLDENDRDGAEVIIKGYIELSAMDILKDKDFEYSYRIEMIASMLLTNYRDFKKWSEQEAELKRLGFIA